MEGLECMDGGKTWNLMLYTRMPSNVCGVGDFRFSKLMRKKGKEGEGEEGEEGMEGHGDGCVVAAVCASRE